MQKFTIYNLQFTIRQKLRNSKFYILNSTFQAGQTLVELLVTLGIAAVFIIALISVSTGALGNINFSRSQGDGNRYAREALEWLRAQRDSSWTTFAANSSSGGTTWCLSNLSWPGSSGNCGTTKIPNTNFTREVVLTTTSATEVTIKIDATWTDAKGTHNAQLNSILTKWK
ncbi:prepilin-type N-terminal cleavage/methylation domain-containing protein [Candidatus Microgenomates bacterium]|nr:prepilin-type N-terminal cleavage/methylation domain-containing protein [Candidatus Microgenomates bacterium]